MLDAVSPVVMATALIPSNYQLLNRQFGGFVTKTVGKSGVELPRQPLPRLRARAQCVAGVYGLVIRSAVLAIFHCTHLDFSFEPSALPSADYLFCSF